MDYRSLQSGSLISPGLSGLILRKTMILFVFKSKMNSSCNINAPFSLSVKKGGHEHLGWHLFLGFFDGRPPLYLLWQFHVTAG